MVDILIVEDGLHERERLDRLFTSATFSVRCAETAEEAERLLEREEFRLVILDIGLEDKSGSHLFHRIQTLTEPPLVIVLTGNPSTHLKQRFLDEGVVAYIVKASPASSNEALLSTVQGVLGRADVSSSTIQSSSQTIPLEEFLNSYVTNSSRDLFYDAGDKFPPCTSCGSTSYIVLFSHKTQLPPTVEGRVSCTNCGSAMDPELG